MRTTGTNCCIYTLLPPDDGQLLMPKYVEAYYLDKLKINSASSWFHYTLSLNVFKFYLYLFSFEVIGQGYTNFPDIYVPP
jgi:hypothetical protein